VRTTKNLVHYRGLARPGPSAGAGRTRSGRRGHRDDAQRTLGPERFQRPAAPAAPRSHRCRASPADRSRGASALRSDRRRREQRRLRAPRCDRGGHRGRSRARVRRQLLRPAEGGSGRLADPARAARRARPERLLDRGPRAHSGLRPLRRRQERAGGHVAGPSAGGRAAGHQGDAHRAWRFPHGLPVGPFHPHQRPRHRGLLADRPRERRSSGRDCREADRRPRSRRPRDHAGRRSRRAPDAPRARLGRLPADPREAGPARWRPRRLGVHHPQHGLPGV
ncbi:MAG: Dehydrogenases with different specificities (related to short-chain alcohol dehydrogenases), partial [uncultured Rubrobacteraceae bacterium]